MPTQLKTSVSAGESATKTSKMAPPSLSLMDLPGELRIQIYKLILVHHGPLTVVRREVKPELESVDRGNIRRDILRESPYNSWFPAGMEDEMRREEVMERWSTVDVEVNMRLEEIMKRNAVESAGKKAYKLDCTSIVLAFGKKKYRTHVSHLIQLDVLYTSKAIYQEALGVFLRENAFVFERANVLEEFCNALGAQVKSLGRVTVKKMGEKLAPRQICVLSRLEEPAHITLPARVNGLALDPRVTLDMLKPILWRLNMPVASPGTFYPSAVPEDDQDKRLHAFKFDVSASSDIRLDPTTVETYEDSAARAFKFKALVKECWEDDKKKWRASKKRSASGELSEGGGSKKRQASEELLKEQSSKEVMRGGRMVDPTV